jgi:hypothetical protein
MIHKTPKQLLADTFGTRQDLVAAIAPLIGADDAEKKKLLGTTNAKLLRIHEVASLVNKRFGGKSGLIDAIAKLQFAGGKANPGWREKMNKFTVKRLFDKHRQLGGDAPAK